MHIRERILTSRLLEKVSKHPEYAARLGIICTQEPADPEDEEKPPQSR
ncbi:MAG: hypothetical protein IKK11_02395 [Oscillospiraceae bacterium]|nr:hypothetical protein [Oscillospiraceae bacterium]